MPRSFKLYSVRMRASRAGKHISGAEGIYTESAARRIVAQYTERALSHSLGKPDSILVTVEELNRKPREISALRVAALRNETPRLGRGLADRILSSCGIGAQGSGTAWAFLGRRHALRGGILLNTDGVRMDPNLERGVRVSRMGISAATGRALSDLLSGYGWDNQTVSEAVILASKVHAHPDIVAELCISDDPDYTTGYVASRQFGYVRIPHLKKAGSRRGGRVFFIQGGADIREVLEYLEREPVLVTTLSGCLGVVSGEMVPAIGL